ncbi:MAG: Flp pilus assembly protein CpaB [Alphaproteobacteria bacterium]|nr:MAG: Flp pilus assembly protein CpaB [Alphaproteobacteria bacterium]
MRTRAYAMLAVAVVLAGLAVILAQMWVRDQTRLSAHADPRASVATVEIVVAARSLRFGDPLLPEMLRLVPWPAAAIPEGAFRSIAAVASDSATARRVVLRAIEAGEAVLAAKISSPGGQASLSTLVAPDMRAVAVPVAPGDGIAALIRPDDRVDVLLTRRASGLDVRRSGQDLVVEVLLQNVRVLGFDPARRGEAGSAGAAPGRAATLEVTPVQAQRLALARKLGTLSLALRHVRDTGRPRTPALSTRMLARPPDGNGTAKVVAAPASAGLAQRIALKAQAAMAAARTVSVPDTTSVRVYRGLELSRYEVHREGGRHGTIPVPAPSVDAPGDGRSGTGWIGTAK